jgi:hypothetical protein
LIDRSTTQIAWAAPPGRQAQAALVLKLTVRGAHKSPLPGPRCFSRALAELAQRKLARKRLLPSPAALARTCALARASPACTPAARAMAAPASADGGHDTAMFIDELPAHSLCGICSNVMRDPASCPEGHTCVQSAGRSAETQGASAALMC